MRHQGHGGVAQIGFLERRVLLAAPADWVSHGPGGGGAFFAPSINPSNSNEIFASSDMTELFHSVNFGASWRPEDFRQIQGNRLSTVQFTNTPGLEYALDYSIYPGDASATPKKTTDGGATWTKLAGWAPDGDGWSLYVDAANPNRVVVSDYTHLYFSIDGGASFTQKYTGLSSNGLFMAGAFFDGQNIYLGTNDGLLTSTNGGLSFALSSMSGIASGQGMFSFTGAKENGTTRLYCVTFDHNATDDFLYPGLNVEGVPASTDPEYPRHVYSLDVGQSAWTDRSNALPAGLQPRFVSMAANNISIAYVAGDDGSENPIIGKTSNGGTSWTSIFNTASNGNIATGWGGSGGDRHFDYGGGALGFEVDPADANRVVVTDLGFIHTSSNGGATWQQAYVSPADQNPAGSNTPLHKAYQGIGLEDTSAWWLTWADANTQVAGYTDINGTRSTNAGQSWAFPTNIGLAGNSIYQISQASSGTLYAAASTIHDIYQSTRLTDSLLNSSSAQGSIIYSTDKGATWATLHNFGNSPVVYTAIDPSNANRMYASVINSGTGGIYVTNNLSAGTGAMWTKLTSPPRTQGHPFNIKVLNGGSLVATYSARQAPSFTASSGVFYSSDGGATWQDRTLIGAKGSPGMQYWTKDITIDPTDASQNTWWAAVRSGYGGDGSSNDKGGLYKTTDRGLSWTRVFSADSVESCTITATGEMYLATTGSGLWYSVNAEAATPTFTQQANYPFVQPERIFINPFNSSDIWVSSFGYGLVEGTNAFAVQQGTTLNLDASIAGGAVTLSSSGGTITASAPSGTYTFSDATLTSIVFNGTGGNDTLNVNTSLSKMVVVAGAGGNDMLAVNGGTLELISDTGGLTSHLSASVAAGATLQFDTSQHLAGLTANGTALLAGNGTSVLSVSALTFGSTGKLDLSKNALILDYTGPVGTQVDDTRSELFSGKLISNSADATHRLGYGDNAVLGKTTFAGQAVDGTAIMIRYTFAGDANLDGKVDIADLGLLATHYGGSGSWTSGDFNYDGSVNIADLGLLATDYGAQ